MSPERLEFKKRQRSRKWLIAIVVIVVIRLLVPSQDAPPPLRGILAAGFLLAIHLLVRSTMRIEKEFIVDERGITYRTPQRSLERPEFGQADWHIRWTSLQRLHIDREGSSTILRFATSNCDHTAFCGNYDTGTPDLDRLTALLAERGIRIEDTPLPQFSGMPKVIELRRAPGFSVGRVLVGLFFAVPVLDQFWDLITTAKDPVWNALTLALILATGLIAYAADISGRKQLELYPGGISYREVQFDDLPSAVLRRLRGDSAEDLLRTQWATSWPAIDEVEFTSFERIAGAYWIRFKLGPRIRLLFLSSKDFKSLPDATLLIAKLKEHGIPMKMAPEVRQEIAPNTISFGINQGA